MSGQRPPDCNEAVNHFLKLHSKELELQALKLTGCYGIDFHELLSRTACTVWEKWPGEFSALSESERHRRTVYLLINHARNLSKSRRRFEEKVELAAEGELERLTRSIVCQDSVEVEAIFEDKRLQIYKAISLLDGRCKDVMTLIALGLEDAEIRQSLSMTVTNLTSTKARARKLLRKILAEVVNGDD